MSLEKLLSDKRSSIITKWRDLIVGSYPTGTQRFLKKEKNRFSNPVGQTIAEDLEILFDELISTYDTEKITASLNNIIRIRAIQDFKPSQAVAFVLQLKKLFREELQINSPADELTRDIKSLEDKIDHLALLAFDIYTQCRQKIYELRVNEVRNQVEKLLKRANLTIEIPEYNPNL